MIYKTTLGMPHLNYHGLDQQWVLKQLGHHHWTMLGPGSCQDSDERLYASFFYCHLNFCEGQHQFKEFDNVTINSELFKYNNQIYRSVHSVSNHQTTVTATLDSVFVKKSVDSNRLTRNDPRVSPRDIPVIDHVSIEQHRALKRELRISSADNTLKLSFSPENYFNAVKILYYANYVGLVSQSEWLWYPHLKNPIKDLKIYYFANIEVGNEVYGRTVCQDQNYSTTLFSNNQAIAHCIIQR